MSESASELRPSQSLGPIRAVDWYILSVTHVPLTEVQLHSNPRMELKNSHANTNVALISRALSEE